MKRSSEASSMEEEEEKEKADRSSPQTPAATPTLRVSGSYEYKRRKKQLVPLTPFSEPDVLGGLQFGKSSSERKGLEEYFARRKKIQNSLFGMSPVNLVPSLFANVNTCPSKSECLVNKQDAGVENQGVINLEGGDVTRKPHPIVFLDLDTDDEDLKVSSPAKGGKAQEQNDQLTTPSDQASNDVGGHAYPTMTIDLDDENSRPFCADVGADNPSEVIAGRVTSLNDQVHIREKTSSTPILDLDFSPCAAVGGSEALEVVNEQVADLLNHAVSDPVDEHVKEVDKKMPSHPIGLIDLDSDNEDLRPSSPAKGIKSEDLNEQFTTLSDQASNNVGEQASLTTDIDLDDEDNENCCAGEGVNNPEEVVTVQANSLTHQVHNTEKRSFEQVAPVIYTSNSKNIGDLSSLHDEDVDMTKPTNGLSRGNMLAEGCVEYDDSLKKEATFNKDKGVYVGVKDDTAEEERYHRNDAEDNLEDIWKEMTFAMECSKEVDVGPSSEEHVREVAKDCDHSFILKDDLGYVCRVCGIIQKGIETIFEFIYSKGKKSTRTYMTESQNRKHGESNKDSSANHKLPEDDMMVTEINAHPRHRKEMRAHQLEGFKFLQSNLFSDTPGGCILAHAPGSGKTFLIISFIQSFLAKYPGARPLIVLPKGILSTWKKEFQKWQVEDIPLHDFYTSKADSRSQQLDVLKSWVKKKSILFLGFKQVSSIICDCGSNATTLQCQEILLKVPTILILDEGHTSRNDETDVFQSLAKVNTPRKVVLSGTLYQNHVKEVFNILNLVCPRFLKSMASKGIHKRIMSRVQIEGVRKQLKGNSESAFFDLVEHALTKDENRTRTEAVIEDLREMTHKILHYYKGDFLEELPGLVDFTVLLNLSHKQKAEVPYLLKLERFKRISEGVAIYMHPNLKNSPGDLPSDDVKMDKMLKEMDPKHGVKMKFFLKLLRLCESAGEKLLVFSQYITPLKLLERLTVIFEGWTPGKEIFLLTGDTKFEARESFMDTFNNSPHAKVFFGSIKACGEGISLVGASRILILDVHLNPSVTRQAIGRAFRPGQKNKVYTYRLVAAESPEEEDHLTSFRKELVSKRWFEWNARCGQDDFELKRVDVNECGDPFFENSPLGEDLKILYKR